MIANDTKAEVILPSTLQPLPVPTNGTVNGGSNRLVGDIPVWQAAAAPVSEPVEQALLQALRRRWRSALGLGLLAAAIGASAVWFLLPPTYTARALLHVSVQPARGLFTAPEGQEGSEEFLAHQRTQAAVLKSRDVIQAALRQPRVAERREVQERPHPVLWLAENLRVDSNLGPEILSVSLSGNHPDDLPVLVNAIVQAYLQERANKERLKQPVRLEQLEGNYRRLADTLRRKRALLRELETNLGVDSPQMVLLRYQSALQQLTDTGKEAMQTRVALKSAQIELALLKSDKNALSQDASLTVDQQLAQDSTYQMLLARKAQLVEEAGHIRGIAAAGVRDSIAQQPMGQLAAIDRELAARRATLLPAIAAQNRAKIEIKIAILQEQQKEVAAELQRQEKEVKRLAEAMRQPDNPTGELDMLRDEVTLADQVLKKVGEQRDLVKMEPALPTRVSLLEAADVPQTKDVKQQAKMAGLTGFSLFGLVLLGICWRECSSRRLYSEEDVVRHLGMNLLGTLPATSSRSRIESNGNLDDQAFLTISVDTLREKLLRVSEQESLRVFMITSASANEGKTTLATELAASLAYAGCKTLLIDGDPHQPQAHLRFDLPAEPGLSEVLAGDLSLQQVVKPTSVPALYLVPAGKANGKAMLGLAQERGKVLFDNLKDHYDIILVESAPILERVDALVLGKHADAVIFSALQDVSTIASIQEAYQRLVHTGVRVLGAVVAGVGGQTFHRQIARQTASRA